MARVLAGCVRSVFVPPPTGTRAHFLAGFPVYFTYRSYPGTKFHIGALLPYSPLYDMTGHTWRAEVRVVTGLLRSHLLQVGAAPPVASESF